MPVKVGAWKSPPVGVPRKNIMARLSSPAAVSAKTQFWMPAAAPTSETLTQVTPWSWEVATLAWPSPSQYPR